MLPQFTQRTEASARAVCKWVSLPTAGPWGWPRGQRVSLYYTETCFAGNCGGGGWLEMRSGGRQGASSLLVYNVASIPTPVPTVRGNDDKLQGYPWVPKWQQFLRPLSKQPLQLLGLKLT